MLNPSFWAEEAAIHVITLKPAVAWIEITVHKRLLNVFQTHQRPDHTNIMWTATQWLYNMTEVSKAITEWMNSNGVNVVVVLSSYLVVYSFVAMKHQSSVLVFSCFCWHFNHKQYIPVIFSSSCPLAAGLASFTSYSHICLIQCCFISRLQPGTFQKEDNSLWECISNTHLSQWPSVGPTVWADIV